MRIEELNISTGAKKMLQMMNIETIEKLLEIDITSIKRLCKSHHRYQTYFDEIYEAIKDLGLHFNYEYSIYYPYISSKCEDLEQLKISYLDLTPELRDYLEKYENIGMFFSTIAYDKKKLKGFLYTTIKSDKDYTWLFNLLHHLGNNGTILLLNIYEYQNILKSKTLSLSSPLNKIISDLRIVQNLNKHEIYFLDDLVKYDEQSLKDLEGIGLKTVETVKEELSKTNFHLGMQPLNYHEIEFSLKNFDINILHLEAALDAKVRRVGINDLNDLFFFNQVKFFTTEELLQIRTSFRKLGFDVSKSFLGATVNGDVLEYNNLILQKRLYEEKLKEINEKLAGKFPMVYSSTPDTKENTFNK